MLFFDQNCVITIFKQGVLRLYHPFYRRNVLVSSNMIEVLGMLLKGAEKNQLKGNESVSFLDVTDFNIWHGMYENPTFMTTDTTMELKTMTVSDCLGLLVKAGFLTEKPEIPYDLAKKSVLDRFKGNVNEQISTEALYRKVPIEQWWKEQKFDLQTGQAKASPYKYSQQDFLQNYFKQNLSGKSVLEIGCGTGFQTYPMAQYAKDVVGVDYSSEYIKDARSKLKGQTNVQFFEQDISKEWIPELKDKAFDYIFMIDIFLFLFDQKFQPVLFEKRIQIVERIKSLLKPQGVLVVMDPHLFWLIPRFGSEHQPFGILSEYKKRFLGTTPTLEEMSKLVYQSKLTVQRIMEPSINQAYEAIDPQGYHFIQQFPQWIVWELVHAR